MTLSREKFVEFLTTRLTPESAKSYLAYVDAFSRAARKDNKYYFTNLDRATELKELLQGGIDTKPLFIKLSKKFRSNIKTGIRALLKFYRFVKASAVKKIISKIPDGMPQSEILEHYVYSYSQWLKNRVIKLDGEHFKSFEAYADSLRYAILDSNIKPRDFFSYTKTFEIKIFQVKLGGNRNFLNRPKLSRSDINSSINKYKLYLAEKYGEKSNRLF